MSPLRMGFKHLGERDFLEDKEPSLLWMTWELLGMVGRVGMVGILDILSLDDFLIKILGGEHA